MVLKDNFLFALMFFSALMIFSNQLLALCERADIDHYLDKGFTPEQITQICTVGKDKGTVNNSDGSTIDKYSFYKLQPEESSEFLLSAIAATDIHFSDNSFSYVSRDCIEYDSRPSGTVIRPKQFCGFIRKTIAYQGLTVLSTPLSRMKLFGKPSVTVKGDFDQAVVDTEELNRLTKYDRKLFLRALKQVKTIKIPIREQFLVKKAKLVLSQLEES